MSLPASFGLEEFQSFAAEAPSWVQCECGVTFEAPFRAEAVRLHEQHQDEMRDPNEHGEVPF